MKLSFMISILLIFEMFYGQRKLYRFYILLRRFRSRVAAAAAATAATVAATAAAATTA